MAPGHRHYAALRRRAVSRALAFQGLYRRATLASNRSGEPCGTRMVGIRLTSAPLTSWTPRSQPGRNETMPVVIQNNARVPRRLMLRAAGLRSTGLASMGVLPPAYSNLWAEASNVSSAQVLMILTLVGELNRA